MNKRLMDRCWEIQIPATAKAVLMAMVYEADKDGCCTPKISDLMIRTCFEKSSVYEWVKWLESNGFIAGFRSEGQATRFTVTVKSIPPNGKPKRAPVLNVAETSDGFQRFWAVYPNTGRKVNLSKCWDVWQRRGLEALADEIERHVMAMAMSEKWASGFEPATITYLNDSRWTDPIPVAARAQLTAKQRETQQTIAALTGQRNQGVIDVYAEPGIQRICH